MYINRKLRTVNRFTFGITKRFSSQKRVIANLAELDGKSHTTAIKFKLDDFWDGFLFRTKDNKVIAFENACAHQNLELDFDDSDFFTLDGNFIQCKVHGALYYPDSGLCAKGPCKNKGLNPIEIEIEGDLVYLKKEREKSKWAVKAELSDKMKEKITEKLLQKNNSEKDSVQVSGWSGANIKKK